MAAIISHMLLGERLLKDPTFLQQFPQLDREAFLWGCQGPDILFFHKRLPWQTGSLRRFGGLLHAGDPTALLHSLAKICRYCRSRENFSQIYSYALGFCCHYCYDRRLHPLVYYNCALLEKTDERGQRFAYHAEMETNLDIMLLRHDTGRQISEFRLTECLPECEGLANSVSLFFSLLLCDLYGLHTPRSDSSTLTSDFRAWTAMLDDAHAVKKPLAAAAEHLLPYIRPDFRRGSLSGKIHGQTADMSFDYGNLLGNVWFNPADRSEHSRLNFYELTDLAQAETLQLTKLFAQEVAQKGSVDFALFTRGINFSGAEAEALPLCEA